MCTISKGITDIFKILAAILVALSHYYNIKSVDGGSLNTLELAIRSMGGNIGVAIFFFLSGYGLMMSEIRYHLCFWQFVKRRFLKVYLPVILVSIIWLPVAFKVGSDNDNLNLYCDQFNAGGGILLIISKLLWKFEDPVLWFIRSIILLYGAFFVFTWLFYQGKTKLAITSLWCMTSVTCIISYFSNGAFGLNSMSGIPLFSVGVVAALYSNRFLKSINWVTLSLIISFALLLLVFYFHPRFAANTAHSFADYLVIAMILCLKINVNVKLPVVFAALTFDVYLVHFKVLTVIRASNVDLSLIKFMIATIIVAFVFYIFRTRIFRLS